MGQLGHPLEGTVRDDGQVVAVQIEEFQTAETLNKIHKVSIRMLRNAELRREKRTGGRAGSMVVVSRPL